MRLPGDRAIGIAEWTGAVRANPIVAISGISNGT